MRKVPALTAHSRGIRHNPPADAMPAPSKLTSTWILLPEQSGVDRSRQKAHTNTAREEAQSLPVAGTVWCRSPAESRPAATDARAAEPHAMRVPCSASEADRRGVRRPPPRPGPSAGHRRGRLDDSGVHGRALVQVQAPPGEVASVSKPSQTPSVPCSACGGARRAAPRGRAGASEVTVAADRRGVGAVRPPPRPGPSAAPGASSGGDDHEAGGGFSGARSQLRRRRSSRLSPLRDPERRFFSSLLALRFGDPRRRAPPSRDQASDCPLHTLSLGGAHSCDRWRDCRSPALPRGPRRAPHGQVG